MQTIVRKGSFDSMHRVMNERFKCFNVHGHTYLYELHFAFEEMKEIGYAIDFKEIKRIACQWIDDKLDHGAILNPADEAMIAACSILGSKVWIMSLENDYCNPTVENIAREIFLAMKWLMQADRKNTLYIQKVVLYETPNCFTECTMASIPVGQFERFAEKNGEALHHYREQKGVVEYDMRKVEPGHE